MFEIVSENSKEYFTRKTLDKRTPIEFAAEYGNLEIVRRYLEQESDRTYNSILAYPGVRRKSTTIISLLKERSIKLPPYVLHAACRQRHGHESISYLIGADSAGMKRSGFLHLLSITLY